MHSDVPSVYVYFLEPTHTGVTLSHCISTHSGELQEVVYAMWACGQHEAHLDELADQALEVVTGRTGELCGGELAKLSSGLVAAEVRDVRPPFSLFSLSPQHFSAGVPAPLCRFCLLEVAP